MKILVIHTWGMGDMIMFTPVLKAIKTKHPDAWVDFLITQKAAMLPLENAPECGTIHTAPNRKFSLLLKALQLRSVKYDISIVTSGVTPEKGSLFSRLVGAKRRVGEYRKCRMKNYTDQVQYDPAQHRTIGNQKLAESVLGKLELGKPFFMVEPSDYGFADRMIQDNGWTGKTLFAIHAGSNKENDFRRWHAEYFVEFVKIMKKRLPEHVPYVISGPDEMDVSKRICRETDIPLVSGIKLSQVAALLSRTQYLLNSDSGMGHIASCFGTRIYTIFGPANARVTGPFTGNKLIIELEPAPACKPCLSLKERTCNRECLLHLKPQMVLDAVLEDIKIKELN